MTALMIQGAGSNVGKSLIVAGLCRAARLRGLSKMLELLGFGMVTIESRAAVTDPNDAIRLLRQRHRGITGRAVRIARPVTKLHKFIALRQIDRNPAALGRHPQAAIGARQERAHIIISQRARIPFTGSIVPQSVAIKAV